MAHTCMQRRMHCSRCDRGDTTILSRRSLRAPTNVLRCAPNPTAENSLGAAAASLCREGRVGHAKTAMALLRPMQQVAHATMIVPPSRRRTMAPGSLSDLVST
eukprot:CAMPEP_0170180644 /NCGR_PEP_ID=MMETSP0040_2-20121228/22551_1 /TAXON_ID=641309 /ORGANISM="Lotharella oceanica, Strain CCMP622" /LENGTH=102 /DNA_ID=CAMNT_0010425353 /DNA_START=23 /DNA_END=331 /DNA_ORIENTATION=-